MRGMRPAALTGALAGLAVIALAGCANDTAASSDRVESTPIAQGTTPAAPATTQDAPTPEVSINNVGFVADDVLPMVYGIVDNPTDDIAVVEVAFAAYDAAGAVLGTTSSYELVRSGASTQSATYISTPDGSVIAKVDAQVSVSQSQPDEHPDSTMTAGNLTVTSDEYTSQVTGTVASTYNQSVTNVGATAICTDASGAVVAAGTTYLDGTVVAGSPAPFSISLTASADPAACAVTAGPTTLSEGS